MLASLSDSLFRGKKMNTLLGTIITALVTDENDKFYFVQKDGVTFALSKEEGKHAIGDMVTGFAYTDSKQKSRLTQKEIKATRDSYDWGEVTEVRKDLGVFVDVGIPDKEIVVSLDVLPELKELWPKKGDKLYIKLDVDKKDRIWGLPAEPEDVYKRQCQPYPTFLRCNARNYKGRWCRCEILRSRNLAQYCWLYPTKGSTFLRGHHVKYDDGNQQ